MLQVWLPLNGNLNNQGLTNVTVTNSGATVDNNGKIGKCYAFNGKYISFNRPLPDPCSAFTVCGWVKLSTGYATNNGLHLISFETSYGRICISKDGLAVRVLLNYGGASSATGSNATDSSISENVWNHYAVTFDSGKINIYINGQLDNSYTIGISQVSITSSILKVGTYSSEASKGCVNDFRLYDHALSPKEIEILSRGLVCHYPLCDTAIEATTNLVTSITAGGRTTVNGDTVTTTGEDKDTYFTLNLSETIVAGTTYTISCDTSGMKSGESWCFPIGAQNNTSLSWCIHNGHNEYTFTANSRTWEANKCFLDDLSGRVARPITFSHFQLEKKDHATLYAGLGGTRSGDTTVYDCSGYQYNGTANKAMTVSDNTARYSKCTIFDGDTDSIKIPFFEMLGSNTSASYSVSVWFYKTQIGSKNYQTILGGQSGFELETRSGSNPAVVLYSWGKGSASYELNKWNHIVFTRSYTDGTKLYLNGQLVIDNGTAGGIPSGNFYIGAWSNTSSQNFDGKISDFRVYATILTDTQVAELYNTAVSVANNGTLMGYELVEV